MSMVRNIMLATMTLSAAGLVGLVQQEGYTDKAVIPVQGDKRTIGFGTTEGVNAGDKTTPPKALARALSDIGKFEGALKKCVTVPLYQREYDTYISLEYNIGEAAFCKSRLVEKLNAGDYAGACGEVRRWTYYQGKNCALPENSRLCGGLAKRREAEYRQCIGGKNNSPIGRA